MERFLDPEGLRQRGLEYFDAWSATFGEVIERMKIAPDGKSLRPRSRFAKFVNLPELQQMFRSFADVQTAEMLALPTPKLETGKAIIIACPMSDEQRELQQHLVERYERLRQQKVDPREDNALNITSDARRSVRILPETITGLSERLASLSVDKATAQAHADDSMTIGKHAVLRKDAMAALGQSLDSLPRTVSDMRRIPLGVYHGLRFGIIMHPFSAPEAYLEGATTIRSTLFRDPGPRAVLNALERLASSYALECERAQRDLAIAETQLRDYQARLGRPFALDSYLAQLTALRDQLRAGLSAAPAEEGEEKRPDVSELVEQIKALKAANTIKSAPGRAAKRVVAAEEPVTARIRRRTETSLTADAAELDVIELPERSSPPHDLSIQPAAMLEHRLARGR